MERNTFPSPPPDQKDIYIGNLPDGTSQGELEALFLKYGKVHSVRLGQKNYGFIRMGDIEALKAIDCINGIYYKGSKLKVNNALHPG